MKHDFHRRPKSKGSPITRSVRQSVSWKGHTSNRELCEAKGLKTPTKAAFLARSALRGMLFEKAKLDIAREYGWIGRHHTLNFDAHFPRRVRRKVALALSKRWYHQVKANLAAGEKPQASILGRIRGLLRLGTQQPAGNTLAASGFGS